MRKTRRNNLPRYTYKCNVCANSFEVSHSISEKLTNCRCGEEESLKRIPSLPFRTSVKQNGQKAGEMVKEFIEEAKRDIDDYKNEISEEVNDV